MPTPQPLKLRRALVVEDDGTARARLQTLLTAVADAVQVECVGGVANAKVTAARTEFDLALVDIGLPDGSGIDLIRWMAEQHPAVACFVVTAMGDAATVLAALRAGAAGYLLKDRDDAELALALRNIQQGGAPIDPFVARGILALMADRGDADIAQPVGLTAREIEILRLVAHGRNNRQIAEATGLSRFTIEDYTKLIYRKLAVGSRAEAVFKAQTQGLL
ncbi:MAG TPA: response regulator transcription factor [Rhodanobacteraceae bacterium]